MDRRTILYRGSLKSCNYHCGYCPFSKHRCSERELEKDRTHWFRFCESLNERAEALNIRALMVVPYGEALIHPWKSSNTQEACGKSCVSGPHFIRK